MFFWLLSLVLSFWISSFHSPIFFPLRTKVLWHKNLSPLVPVCSPHTLADPSSAEKEALSAPFLIRNKSCSWQGALSRSPSFWALHSHVNDNEWRFHPPTPHCSSCPLPFLSNLGTQETAEHVLNSTLGSHRSISLDSSYPLVVLFLCLTRSEAWAILCNGPFSVGPANPYGWDGSLHPRGRVPQAEQSMDTVQGMGSRTAWAAGSEAVEKARVFYLFVILFVKYQEEY